jgi:hypothetical protein
MTVIHKHHIIPKHMGGTDDPSNLVSLTAQEHATAHLALYWLFNKKEDLCAYYMLSGKNQDPEFVRLRASMGGLANQRKLKNQGLSGAELFYGRSVSEEEITMNASKGGKVQGKRNAESGHIQRIQAAQDHVAIGKRSGAKTIAGGRGAFADPVERLKSASKGGKVQGKRNAESGHLKRIANLPGNPRSKGKSWITNGIVNKMIDSSEIMPDGWTKGRSIRKKDS